MRISLIQYLAPSLKSLVSSGACAPRHCSLWEGVTESWWPKSEAAVHTPISFPLYRYCTASYNSIGRLLRWCSSGSKSYDSAAGTRRPSPTAGPAAASDTATRTDGATATYATATTAKWWNDTE